jgi:hypothetical protein
VPVALVVQVVVELVLPIRLQMPQVAWQTQVEVAEALRALLVATVDQVLSFLDIRLNTQSP